MRKYIYRQIKSFGGTKASQPLTELSCRTPSKENSTLIMYDCKAKKFRRKIKPSKNQNWQAQYFLPFYAFPILFS